MRKVGTIDAGNVVVLHRGGGGPYRHARPPTYSVNCVVTDRCAESLAIRSVLPRLDATLKLGSRSAMAEMSDGVRLIRTN